MTNKGKKSQRDLWIIKIGPMKTNINAPTNGEQSTDGHLEENHLEV